jgi:RNA polymerase sigma-70 factor (ECF subfamily)
MDSQTASARFEQLFRAHYPSVLSYARRRAGLSLADDVVAETFLIAWRRLESIPGAELPWLLGVARRVLANQRRRNETQDRLTRRVSAEPPSPGYLDTEVDLELSRALSLLSERDRELLRLIAWEDLTPAEAATVLGQSAVGTRVRLHRARLRLAKLMAPSDSKEGRWKPDPT